MKNIALFESHYRSRSWFLALKNICNLYVISCLKEEYENFILNGVDPSRILNLRNFNSQIIDIDKANKYLLEIEQEQGFNFNNITLMDRRLRLFDNTYIIKYIYFLHKEISKFLNDNKIDAVIIEPTWTHELVAYFICKKLDIKYYAPVRDKIIKNNFYIFNSHLRENFYIRKFKKESNFFDEINREELTPFFKYFSNRNKFRFKKLIILADVLRLYFNKYTNRNIHPELFIHLSNKLIHIYRHYLYSFTIKFYKLIDLKNPFILFTLHVQPEAGIDVVGSKFSNQYECIRQFASGMPVGFILAVKEHPHDFGRRPSSFYRDLKKIPNVVLISPNEKTSNIYAMNNIKMTVSAAGTSSLESALLGIPSLTFVKMYYHELMLLDSFDPYIDRISTVFDGSSKINKRLKIDNIQKYSEIYKNAFDGNCGDFKTDINVLSQQNIMLLQQAFNEIIYS